MLITLGEILQWDVLEGARVVTDSFNPDTPVENITIMEAPDIGKWIDGNNILLTGLYSIYEDKRKIAEFVESLHSGKICALFVKVHRFVSRVPDPIISACQKLGIALVEIPGHIRYTSILYPVIASIFESRVVQLNYHKQTLNTLTGLALGNKGINSIALACAELVKNPVVLYDVDMKCLHATDEAFASVRASSHLEDGVTEELDYSVLETSFAGDERLYRQLLVPVRIFGRTKMYLSIVEQNRSITRMDFVALENVVTVLSFELVKDFAEEEMEGRFKQEIVDDISRRRNLDSIKDRLASINLRTKAKYNALIVEMPESPINRTPAIVKQRLISRDSAKVYDLFLSVKKALGLTGFNSYSANTLTVFIEQPPGFTPKSGNILETLCKRFLEKVQGAFPSMPLHIGYTSAFRSLDYIAELYKNAQDALHISRMLYGENTFCDYDRLGVYKILCMAHDRGDLEAYIPPAVTVLEEYERAGGLPLLETLASYFEHNGNTQRTAKALFIHYKTLYYRLKKIESLTGTDLKSNAETFELQMGLNILRVLGRRARG